MSPEWAEWVKKNTRPYHIHTTNRFHAEYLKELDSMGSDFIDFGFGSGYFSIALANMGNRVQGYDIEPGLLGFAEEAAKRYFVSGKGKLSFTCDIADLKKADVVFSDGLLEHYSDDKVIEIVREQIALAKKFVVFNVPTDGYPWKYNGFGNERWLGIAEWEKILKPFKREIVKLYRYGSGYFLMGVIECHKKAKSESSISSE